MDDRQAFIAGNTGLVHACAQRFRGRGIEYDDLFQAGCVGLVKAADRFDAGRGLRFSTYAVPVILGEIKRYLRDGNSLRVSRSIRDAAYRILKVRENLEEHDEEATIERIAEVMQVQQREVAYALDAISDPVSLYEPVYNKSGDTLQLLDQLFPQE